MIAILVAILITIVGAGLLVALLAVAAALAFFPPLPRDLGGAENLDPRAQKVRIPLPDQDSLDGWYLPGRLPAALLLLHGYGRTHHRMWRYAGFLSHAGYAILTVDFRSSRRRGRAPTTLGSLELAEARAAFAWLSGRPELEGCRLGVFGESLGGSVALRLAAEHPEVLAVVADGAFATARMAVEDTLERWAHMPCWPAAPLARAVGMVCTGHDPFGLDAVQGASRLGARPLLLIHGLEDNRLAPHHPQLLWQAAGGKDPLWIMEGVGHNQGWLRHRHEYEERVRAFLDRHLLDGGAADPETLADSDRSLIASGA